MIPGLIEFVTFVGGMGVGWWARGPAEPILGDPTHPFSPVPIVSAGQSVTVAFAKGDEIQSHRVVEAQDLKEFIKTPKGDFPDAEYRFSHVNERGTFVYVFERSLTDE